MLNHFFADTLQHAAARIAPSTQTAKFQLDKNEQSDDMDFEFKKRVLEQLLHTDWNRYPAADHQAIEAKVADYCSLDPGNIVLSAGSASIITTLLDYFALNQKQIVIAQPAYSLFDYHCKTYNIPYHAWYLSDNLEYDCQTLPALQPGSVLIITSPNNPVGNTMDLAQLENLLNSNPDTYVILDGVYTEFCEVDATPLVKKHPNLIMLRSFSKAFPVAGLRLGYLCASPQTAAIVKKLVLPFSVNPLSLIFASEMLSDRAFMADAKQRVLDIVAERERMSHLIRLGFRPEVLHVFPSEGNFLLIRVFDTAAFEKLMADLTNSGIKVLNTTGFPLLKNTFRVSIGRIYENETFFALLRASMEQSARLARQTESTFPMTVSKLPEMARQRRA